MRLIWATRGRSWGFRFLLDGGLSDPLPTYDGVFSAVDGTPEVWMRFDDRAALRFPDPLGRKDSAGRVIPHEFVVFGAAASSLASVDEARRSVWQRPEVGEAYARVWELPQPPVAGG